MSIYVGITGLRDLRYFDRKQLAEDIHRELSLLSQGQEKSTLLSSLAVGADQLCARIALDLGYELVSPLPFAEYRDDFTGEDLEMYDMLIGKASRTVIIAAKQDLDQAYLQAGRYVVDHCDVLLTVWDGKQQSSICGTQAVMEYAKQRNRRMIQIAPGR